MSATENGQIPAAFKAVLNDTKLEPEKGGGATSATDFKAEAEFWQLKYFELMMHSNQIITALSRPMLAQQVMAQLQAKTQ